MDLILIYIILAFLGTSLAVLTYIVYEFYTDVKKFMTRFDRTDFDKFI